MQIELLAYIITFVVSAGLAVIGISISYQLYQKFKKPVFQILLYQQIFIFSFFIYGIWGNLIIRNIINDFNLSAEIVNKLAVFIPIIGIPFLVVSWFMLLKFGYNATGFKITRTFTIVYFPVVILFPLGIALAIQQKLINVPSHPDRFIIQILLLMNLVVHFLFLLPLLKPRDFEFLKEFSFIRQSLFLYLAGVILYSLALNFFQLFEYISTCISILILFGINILIPLFFRLKIENAPTEIKKSINFVSFCELFEISKREAEIVLEICSGKTNKAIADKLFITLQTVKDHTHRIYTKTGVKSRVQLANLVREKTGEQL